MVSTKSGDLWEARLDQVNAELATLVEKSEALKVKCRASPIWRHNQLFIEASASFSAVPLIYFAGFNAILGDTPGVNASDKLQRWVKSVNRHRSAHVIACMNASAQCSALEGFLRSMNSESTDQAVVDLVRSNFSRTTRAGKEEKLSKRLDGARNQLDMWLKPSGGGRFADWMRLVSLVFGCTVSPTVTEILDDLIMFRHAITHPEDLPDEPTIDSPDAARFVCWSLAAISTATTITHSLVEKP